MVKFIVITDIKNKVMTRNELDTLEVKEVNLDLGSSNGDIGVKTVWDGDKIVSTERIIVLKTERYGRKKVKEILQKVISDIQEKENECFKQMAYMNEHKFEMEREAIRYKQEGYNRSWLMVSSALDEISKLED